jgi:hypothetical protein
MDRPTNSASGRPPARELPDGVTFFAKPFYPIGLIRELGGRSRH